MISDEIRKELCQESDVEALVNARGIAAGDEVTANGAINFAIEDILAEKMSNRSGLSDTEEETLSTKVLVMQPILRFLQLLCENHNRELQVSLIQ